jgi:opacity protein-like surface antigen
MKKMFLLACIAILVLCAASAHAAQVTLAWDANTPTPTGYQLFQRLAGAQYDYSSPIWQGAQTTCTVTVPDGAESFFVVRAYVASGSKTETSGDSNEVSALTKPTAPKNLLLQAIDQLISGLQTLKQYADQAAQ